ncbi:unnamed protein product [Euphydryas editha]|uniref:Uncharacterized protein n=1 Tax=Euphydryas editha TaxID=104508 RepID=A0AAU9TBB3_EUPED|nr:unnamed protein product [Euphydryas editha]
MDGEGMVAVVRGLQGSGLAVTLLDSGRQFTLLPENYSHPAPRTNGTYATASQCASNVARRESGVQATDGRYTSTYKMMHCHYIPTSPPDEVTEFPPQRPEICPGHGNFMVGGQGSGENHCYPMKTSEYRGAMCWPDRGSVFSPRPSLQPDSFATSLRKYPNISQDRSSEIVERLINFTQAKNAYKNNRNVSPTRNIESNMSNQTFCMDTKSSRNTSTEKLKRGYQPEVVIKPKRCDESPTREIFRQTSAEVEAIESWRKPTFCKTNDVRYLKDISRKVRESIRSLSPHLDNRPERLNPRERYNSGNEQGRALPQWSTDTVNMEIQATVQVTSREIMTLPRIVPPQRTIAVPLTPAISKTDEKLNEIESDKLNFDTEPSLHQIAQIIQTKLSLVDIQVQTVSSAIEFSGRRRHKRKPKIRSRSEEKLQIIELLKYRHASGLKKSLKSRSYRSHDKNKTQEVFVGLINKFESKIFNVNISDNKKCALERYRPNFARTFRAEVAQCKLVDDDALKEILKDWINLIPLKEKNKLDAHKEKKYIQHDFFNYLKRFVSIPPEHIRKDKLKADILNRLKLIPLESKSDKILILNRLAEILIDKVTQIGRKRWDMDITKKNRNELQNLNSLILKRPNSPCDKELEDFVLKYTALLLKNSGINISELVIRDIEDELLDIIITYLKTENIDDDIIKSDIVCVLYNQGISEEQAYSFAYLFMKKFKEILINNTKSHKVGSKTLIILPNICCHGAANEPDFTIKSITDEDIVANLKQYTNELCQQIKEWLNDLQIQIPKSPDKDLKVEAINELANDIVERCKYLELNPCNEISNEAEIEHLKYQIFKWIKKLVAEDNLKPVQRAPDLMNRIKRIPVPILTRLQGSCGKHPNQIANTKIKNDIGNEKSELMDDNEKLGIKHSITNQIQGTTVIDSNKNEDHEKRKGTLNDSAITNKCNMSIPCVSTSKSCCVNQIEDLTDLNDSKNNDQLEAEYEQFVQNWIQKIPMNVTDFEDESILEKARMGIYNGLWKVVSKLNCDPATYYNRFLYEDLLEDAIDDLLDCLPQSSDLTSKRHLLKVELIEKTISINDKIKENEEASFKNKLIQNIVTDLRKQGITDSQNQNPTKLHEDLQVIKLVEDYLLVIKFKNEDKIISEIYKNKLLKQVADFVKELKENHAKELKDIDVATYQTDLIEILNKVPLPSEITLNQEADDVLLGIEIEEWYQDLPIVSNNDYVELYQRRKQRDILVKKIKEIGNQNIMDSTENALRHEVSKFLEKTPLEEGESLNINFMVDELVNRLKNKTKHNQSLSTKKVDFKPPDNYDEFSKNIPLCSSFIELPKSNKSLVWQQEAIKKSVQETQYDKMHNVPKLFEQTNATRIEISEDNDPKSPTRQTRVVIQEPPSYRTFAEERPHSSSFKETSNDQWFSLLSSHPDVGTQTKNINMHTISPYINDETTLISNKDNTKTQHIPERPQNSSYELTNINKQRLSLQRTHPDVGTQTPDINMHTPLPYVGNEINDEATQTNIQNYIGMADIPKCCQQQHYSFPRESQEAKHNKIDASPIARSSTEYTENINIKSYPSTSKTEIKTEMKPCQLNSKDMPYLRDISETGKVENQIFIKEEDVSSLKCSTECQADNRTKYSNQVIPQRDTLKQKYKSEDTHTLKGISSIVDQGKIKAVTPGACPLSPLVLDKTSEIQKSNAACQKLSYDSDEEDDIPCRCIERYMKRAPKRHPCEAFDRLPYFPILYPYPYFI